MVLLVGVEHSLCIEVFHMRREPLARAFTRRVVVERCQFVDVVPPRIHKAEGPKALLLTTSCEKDLAIVLGERRFDVDVQLQVVGDLVYCGLGAAAPVFDCIRLNLLD